MLVFFKNFFLFCLSRLLRLFAPKKRGSAILIVSATGLGDTLFALPAIQAIKTSFPSSKLYILTTGIGKELLLHNPYLEQPLVVTAQNIFALRKILCSLNLETVLMFHTSDRYLLPLVASTRASNIIGIEGEQKGLDALLTIRVKNQNIHEIDKRLLLAKAMGAEPSPAPLQIPVTEEEEKEALLFLKKQGWDEKRPLIGLQPGAKDKFKFWPEEYFVKTASALKDYNPFFVITGSMGEANLVKTLARQIPGSLPLFGQISLRTLLGVMRKFSLYITNDTGPMHLAFSQNIKTIALFAPTDPRLCGPYLAKNAHVIAKKLTCSPCLKKKCRDPFCMRQISVEEVVAQAKELLPL